MRLHLLAAGMLLVASAALAQPTPPPPDMIPPAGPAPTAAPPPPEAAVPPAPSGPAMAPNPQGRPPRMSPKQHFAMANVTNDGKLTLDQARQAHWGPIAKNFATIDRENKGYITLQDIREWRQAQRAARQGMPPSPPPAPQ